jgi:hypothetical protein
MADENTLTVGQKVVTTAGTAVKVLTTDDGYYTLIIKALSTNTGLIYVGNSDVDSTNGFELDAGEETIIVISEGQLDIYIDSSVNLEGVSYIYYNG